MAELASFSTANASIGDTCQGLRIAEVFDAPNARYRWEEPFKKTATLDSAIETGDVVWLGGVGLCRALNTSGAWEFVGSYLQETYTGNAALSLNTPNLAVGDAYGDYVVSQVFDAVAGKYLWARRIALGASIAFKVLIGSPGGTFTIPITPNGTDNFVIDWGDNSKTKSGTGGLTHTYAAAGTYSITIRGTKLNTFAFNNAGDRLLVTSIDTLEVNGLALTDCSGMWHGCSNAATTFTSVTLTGVTTVANMFNGCTTGTFDLTSLDIPSATTTLQMFLNCTAARLPLYSLTVPLATTTVSMFDGCSSAQLFLPSLSLPLSTNTTSMFNGCNSASLFLKTLTMPVVTDATTMFQNCWAAQIQFNSNIFNYAALVTATSMFRNCYEAKLNITRVTGVLTNVTQMFQSCQQGLRTMSQIILPSVVDGTSMFDGCVYARNTLSTVTLTNLQNGTTMFRNCANMTFPLILTLPALTNGTSMFSGCSLLGANTNTVVTANALTTGTSMFFNCVGLQGFASTTALVTAASMYKGCIGIIANSFPSSLANLTTAQNMFQGCSQCTFLSSTMSYPALTNATSMFADCTKGVFPQTSITFASGCITSGMFDNCVSGKFPLSGTMPLIPFRNCIQAQPLFTAVTYPNTGGTPIFHASPQATFNSTITWTIAASTGTGTALNYQIFTLAGPVSQIPLSLQPTVSAANLDAFLIELDTKWTHTVTSCVIEYQVANGTHLDSARSPAALTAISNLLSRGWTRTGTY